MTIKRLSRYLPILLLILLPLVTFWQTLNHDFVWDDDVHIIYNDYDSLPSSKGLLKYWSPKPKLIYAPITYTVWGMLKSGKFSPAPYHLTNIIVHILTVLLVFSILGLLFKNTWPALIGAMLFALHPLQVETVAWATGLRTLLCGLFGFLMLLLFIIYREKKNSNYLYLLSLFTFFLALASKPSAIILPAFLFLFDYFYYKNSLKNSIITLVPYVLLTIPFLWILMQTNTPPEYIAPLWSRPLIMTDTICFYLYKLLLPLKLCSFYGRTPSFIMQSEWFYLSWILPAVITWVLFKTHKGQLQLTIGALLFFIGFLPVSGLIPFEGQNWNTVADRYLYISMIGAAFCLAYVVNRWREKKIVWIITSGLILFWFLRSMLFQVPQWQNDWSIWNSAITYFPDRSVPYSKRGEIYMEQGNLQSALYDFQRAVQRNPNFSKAYNNIGLIYSHQENWDQALEAYLHAIRLNPRLTKTHKNIGLIFIIKKDYEKAEQAFKNAIKYDPQYADAYYQLGRAYGLRKKPRAAELVFQEAIKLQPDHLKAHLALASLYLELDKNEEAYNAWKNVLLLDPGNQRAVEYFQKNENNQGQ
jgi:tetratricopeptide (TPR) repeat protein